MTLTSLSSSPPPPPIPSPLWKDHRCRRAHAWPVTPPPPPPPPPHTHTHTLPSFSLCVCPVSSLLVIQRTSTLDSSPCMARRFVVARLRAHSWRFLMPPVAVLLRSASAAPGTWQVFYRRRKHSVPPNSNGKAAQVCAVYSTFVSNYIHTHTCVFEWAAEVAVSIVLVTGS